MGLISAIRNLFGQNKPWYEQPRLKAMRSLIGIRDALRKENLHDTEDAPLTGGLPPAAPDSSQRKYRQTEGTYNDLKFPKMGAVDTRFGRNFPLKDTRPDNANLMNPNPRLVSKVLLTRHSFQPATILNLLAAAWIQFQVHDWFSHGKTDAANGEFEIPLDAADDWPRRPMRVPKTEPDAHPSPDANRRPTFTNHVTHWWDGSQIYGSHKTIAAKVRTGQDGKLKVTDSGILPLDGQTGLDLTAIVDNWWIGLSMLHTLFTLEHNAIATELKRRNPHWEDEQLFQTARLINAALMAKIHTIEWTPGILPNPIVQLAMRVNWRGITGEKLQKLFPGLDDNELLGGIIGSHAEHHAAPYALTEEFVSVYRMHPLIPDEYNVRSVDDGSEIIRFAFPEVSGKNARKVTETVRMQDLFYSFGIAHPGAICLHNYPKHLQNLHMDDGRTFDLAVVDILRDRERGVPRYNQFRELLRMPRVKSFEELTDNPQWAAELKSVYGDIDKMDLMAGLYAEKLPPGFGFSETAFRVFVLMASRRLKSDRFYTDDYTKEIYTQWGLDHIEDNGLKSVLLRHYPELGAALDGVENPFAPWKKVR